MYDRILIMSLLAATLTLLTSLTLTMVSALCLEK